MAKEERRLIKKLDGSNINIIELGKGTTFVSQVLVDNGTASSGIAFSNHSDGLKHGDETIIEITDFKGVASYTRAILQLLQSWEIEGLESHLESFLDTLKPLLEFDKTNIK